MRTVTHYTHRNEPGCDLHDALQDVCRQLLPDSYMEIGVDGGGSLRTVLTCCTPSRVTLADIWVPDYCAHKFKNHGHIDALLKAIGYAGTVTYLDGDSEDTIKALPNNDLYDLILVDGDHSGPGAMADLIASWIHLNEGGVLVMDDIRHPSYPWLFEVFNDFADKVGATEVPQTAGNPSNAGVLIKPCATE